MTSIAISTTFPDGGEYAFAVAAAGGTPQLLHFEGAIESQLTGVAGVLLSGGGDVDPRHYGVATDLASEVDDVRDTFELALVRHARERHIPTLCICRGLQVANVAFGGTLIADIATAFNAETAALHRLLRDGKVERGLIPGHELAVRPGSLLATIAPRSALTTGSRHHQSIERVAPDLRVTATAPDGIVEAIEARFASPFWLGVQWHPESTLTLDDGASRAIFDAFVAAARRFSQTAAAEVPAKNKQS